MVWMFSFWSELYYFLLPKSTGMYSEKRIVWGHLIQSWNITEHLPLCQKLFRVQVGNQKPLLHPPPPPPIPLGVETELASEAGWSRERGQRTTDQPCSEHHRGRTFSTGGHSPSSYGQWACAEDPRMRKVGIAQEQQFSKSRGRPASGRVTSSGESSEEKCLGVYQEPKQKWLVWLEGI